ncbi:MAG: ABC transporter ATP-binding protein [Rhabdochlamydiaceae bacterium]
MSKSDIVLHLQNVTKLYPGQSMPVVDDISLEVEQGKILALVGPSGCGKSTTLKMINRLVEYTSGKILVDGRDITEQDPIKLRRKMGYVIQEVGLFPHMTIGENISLLPRLEGWANSNIEERIKYLLAKVGLEPETYSKRYPRELSGGQAQRVGVARALALDPPILLMDEPFGALDPIIRSKLQEEFLAIIQEFKKTIVFVTHDLNEALRMGDQVAVMNGGKIIQIGSPQMLLRNSTNKFVSDFIGSDKAVKLLSISTVGEVLSATNKKTHTPSIQDPENILDTNISITKNTGALSALEIMLQNKKTYILVSAGLDDTTNEVLTFDHIMEYVN